MRVNPFISACSTFSQKPGRVIDRLKFASDVVDNGAGIIQFTAQTFKHAGAHGPLSKLEAEAAAARAFRDLCDTPLVVVNALSMRAFVVCSEKTGAFEIPNNKPIFKPLYDLVQQVCILAARILNAVKQGYRFAAKDLGKHLDRMHYAAMALWSTVCVISIAQSMQKYFDAKADITDGKSQNLKRRKALLGIVNSVIDLGACANDFGFFAVKGNIAANVAGASLGLVSNVLSFRRNVFKDVI